MTQELISQDFNDNVNNENTDLCFYCRTYKLKTDFSEPKTCKKCFNEYETLCKQIGIIFIEKEKDRKARTLFTSEYYLNDVYAIIGNKEVFIRGYNPSKEDYNYPDHERAEIFGLKMQFLKSNDSWFRFYCGHHGRINNISPLEFIQWIKDNNYNFGENYDCSLEPISWGLWDFSGNLDKYSCAFNFRIYDKGYLRQVKDALRDNYFKNVRVGKIKIMGQ